MGVHLGHQYTLKNGHEIIVVTATENLIRFTLANYTGPAPEFSEVYSEEAFLELLDLPPKDELIKRAICVYHDGGNEDDWDVEISPPLDTKPEECRIKVTYRHQNPEYKTHSTHYSLRPGDIKGVWTWSKVYFKLRLLS